VFGLVRINIHKAVKLHLYQIHALGPISSHFETNFLTSYREVILTHA